MAGIGGLIAFFVVVASSCGFRFTRSIRRRPPTGPRFRLALKGRNLFAQNGCYVCHSGYTRPQDVRRRCTSSTRRCRSRATSGERPVAEPARNRAHGPRPFAGVRLASGRLAAGALLRPALRRPDVADAGDEVALLGQAGRPARRLRPAAEREVRPPALRGPAVREARVSSTRASRSRTRASRARTSRSWRRRRTLKPPENQLEEAPNLSQIDRSYWLSGDPLPVTSENLNRGKEVFLQRCVGCHGMKGDGKGPAAQFMSPPPADFTDKDDACCGGDTGPGRLLLPDPARLAGHRDGELRRPPFGRRHLARRPVREDDPEPHARSRTICRRRRLHRLAAVEGAARLGQDPPEASQTTSASTRSRAGTRSCRKRCACSPASLR